MSGSMLLSCLQCILPHAHIYLCRYVCLLPVCHHRVCRAFILSYHMFICICFVLFVCCLLYHHLVCPVFILSYHMFIFICAVMFVYWPYDSYQVLRQYMFELIVHLDMLNFNDKYFKIPASNLIESVLKCLDSVDCSIKSCHHTF